MKKLVVIAEKEELKLVEELGYGGWQVLITGVGAMNVINALKGLFGAVNSNPQQPADPQQPTQPAQSGSETSQTIDAAGLLSKLAEMFRSLLAQLLQANATATV